MGVKKQLIFVNNHTGTEAVAYKHKENNNTTYTVRNAQPDQKKERKSDEPTLETCSIGT